MLTLPPPLRTASARTAGPALRLGSRFRRGRFARPSPSPPPSPSPRPAAHPLPRLRSDESVVILVRLRQLLPVQQQPAEAVVGAQFKLRVHLDRFKRADLNANLAAHADRNIDIELRRINLQLAHIVRLLVLALLNIDAFRRALFLADLAGHTTQPRLPVRRRRTQGTERRAHSHRRHPLLRILTVVSRSFETKLPKKFLAVSAIPFRCLHPAAPHPSEIPYAIFRVILGSDIPHQHLPIHFAQHNIHASKNQHHIRHVMSQAHIFQNGQVDQARRPHTIAIRVRTPSLIR